jgi:uncharacterized hydrophobic protein (TIGR00271 family)
LIFRLLSSGAPPWIAAAEEGSRRVRVRALRADQNRVVTGLAMNDMPHLRGAVFFEEPGVAQKLSRFWLLLTLSSIIAGAGVVGDSTATVIGAMIVAPLMTPILGTMLAVVLGDRKNLLRSIGLVIAGACLAVAIGYLIGMMVPEPVTAATNSQVASRVHPKLIDLLAALATGAVGSIALVRSDISDTLPGVAIAISLVPPLSVVGLTLEAGAHAQAAGAVLLFVTNVAAILGAGTVVMGLYRVHRLAPPPAEGRTVHRRRAVAIIAVMLVAVGAALTQSSLLIAHDQSAEAKIRRVSNVWASANGWRVMDVSSSSGRVVVRVAGPPPLPSTDSLVQQLVRSGIDPSTVEAQLQPGQIVDLRRPGT